MVIDIEEQVADELLKGCKGIYTERQLKRQEREHSRPQTLFQLHEHLAETSRRSAFHSECVRATLNTAKRLCRDQLTIDIIDYRLQGFTHREIAHHLRVSDWTVRDRINRATKRTENAGAMVDIYDVIAEVFGLPVELVLQYCRVLIRG